jgi:hypothetical protein
MSYSALRGESLLPYKLLVKLLLLMGSFSPNKLLRSFPTLQADQIKAHALAIIKMIPDDVYEAIVNHAL